MSRTSCVHTDEKELGDLFSGHLENSGVPFLLLLLILILLGRP